jgi:uncharacterized protein involved in response to NO
MLKLNGQLAHRATNRVTGSAVVLSAPATSVAYWTLFLGALLRSMSVSAA